MSETLPSRNMMEDRPRDLHDQILNVLGSSENLFDNTSTDRMLIEKLRARLLTLNEKLHEETERAQARDFLSNWYTSDPFKGTFINKGFSALLTGQVAHWNYCDILSKDVKSVAIVGGGALPQTQFFLSEALGLPVCAVERDGESAELCAAVLNRIGSAQLSVVHAEGSCYDYSGHGLVVVATMVRNKNAVAQQVLSSSPNAIFSPRAPVGNHRMWREPLDMQSVLQQGWNFWGRWEPKETSVVSLCFRSTPKEQPAS